MPGNWWEWLSWPTALVWYDRWGTLAHCHRGGRAQGRMLGEQPEDLDLYPDSATNLLYDLGQIMLSQYFYLFSPAK